MKRGLLVTGFGPFPTMPRNPSAELARRVAASPRWRVLGIRAKALVLTTAYDAIREELGPALKDSPTALLMVGVAGRSRRVRVEERATSRRSSLFPDAAGARASKPAQAKVRRTAHGSATALVILGRHGVPARRSRDAGRYLCNAAYFFALKRVPSTLFIHIPKPPSKPLRRKASTGKPAPGRRDDTLERALVEIGLSLLRRSRS